MSRRKPLVTQHLEKISREMLEEYQDIIRDYTRGRPGVYALYRKNKLHYVGLASNLQQRLRSHLRDRHRNTWDSFSIYLTIGDQHMKELESLLLRIVDPPGNKVTGKFARSENLKHKVRKDIRTRLRQKESTLFGERTHKQSSRKLRSQPPGISKLTGRAPILAPYLAEIPGRKLRRRYKGKLIRATVLRDGAIRTCGKVFNSPSLAAKAAIGRMCNGWTFWEFERSPGNWVPLKELRKYGKKTTIPTKIASRVSRAKGSQVHGRIPVLARYLSRIPKPQLRREYKGRTLTARILSDGSIKAGGKVYTSPSLAARDAIDRRSCNGWTFWKYEKSPGNWVPLDELRK